MKIIKNKQNKRRVPHVVLYKIRMELIPDHTYANICGKHDVMPDGTEFVGIGIHPDIEVKETYKSYFLEPEDAATKEVLQYLRSTIKP